MSCGRVRSHPSTARFHCVVTFPVGDCDIRAVSYILSAVDGGEQRAVSAA